MSMQHCMPLVIVNRSTHVNLGPTIWLLKWYSYVLICIIKGRYYLSGNRVPAAESEKKVSTTAYPAI